MNESTYGEAKIFSRNFLAPPLQAQAASPLRSEAVGAFRYEAKKLKPSYLRLPPIILC